MFDLLDNMPANDPAFRQEAEVYPVLHRTPVHGVTSKGNFHPKGVPFANYRSTIGAGLASWVLGMMSPQDLLSLTVAAVRDLRSLGPPTHCWQRSVVQGILADVMSLEYYVGPLDTRTDLLGSEVYKDAVASLRAFDSFHNQHCERRDNTVYPLASCLAKLENAITVHLASGARGSVQQLLPVLSLACRYREQLDHWLSAGSEEVESLAFILGRALVLGMSAASLTNSHDLEKVHNSFEVLRAGSEPEEEQLQQKRTAMSAFGEPGTVTLQRDLTVHPDLAVDYHVNPNERPTSLSPALQMNALDAQTLEDLRPFMPDENAAFFDFGMPDSFQFKNEDASTNGNKYSENSRGDVHGDTGYLERRIYTSAGPIATLAENLRSFCKNSRSTIAVELCSRLRRWLEDVEGVAGLDGQRSRGALSTLVKVAEWNTQRSQTVLELSDLGLTLEPIHERPGVTGQGELDRAGALSVIGNISHGKETVRHQRPSERAVWQRVSWVLKALKEMAYLPFDTE